MQRVPEPVADVGVAAAAVVVVVVVVVVVIVVMSNVSLHAKSSVVFSSSHN